MKEYHARVQMEFVYSQMLTKTRLCSSKWLALSFIGYPMTEKHELLSQATFNNARSRPYSHMVDIVGEELHSKCIAQCPRMCTFARRVVKWKKQPHIVQADNSCTVHEVLHASVFTQAWHCAPANCLSFPSSGRHQCYTCFSYWCHHFIRASKTQNSQFRVFLVIESILQYSAVGLVEHTISALYKLKWKTAHRKSDVFEQFWHRFDFHYCCPWTNSSKRSSDCTF